MTEIHPNYLGDAKFYGSGYDEKKDRKRLVTNLQKVYGVMHNRETHTLAEITKATGVPEASVSACLRTLRNQYGYEISKRRVGSTTGLWCYWISNHFPTLPPKKMKPIGNAELFGKMMQAIYACAKTDINNMPPTTHFAVNEAAVKWAHDMVARVRSGL